MSDRTPERVGCLIAIVLPPLTAVTLLVWSIWEATR